MRITLTIKDDTAEETFDLLPSPFTRKKEIGKAEVTTASGDVYTDYVYRKFSFEYEWGYLTAEEYAVLEGFFDRQFSSHKYPRITIPALEVADMPVRMELSEQNIVNDCGVVENVSVAFRETRQL